MNRRGFLASTLAVAASAAVAHEAASESVAYAWMPTKAKAAAENVPSPPEEDESFAAHLDYAMKNHPMLKHHVMTFAEASAPCA